jgi:hypothetical protein
VVFKVTRLEEVDSIPRDELSDGPIVPLEGAELITAEVIVKNNGETAVDPFCGENSAALLDRNDRNFQPLDDQIEIKGNDICGDATEH